MSPKDFKSFPEAREADESLERLQDAVTRLRDRVQTSERRARDTMSFVNQAVSKPNLIAGGMAALAAFVAYRALRPHRSATSNAE